jgi:hypothetical protein
MKISQVVGAVVALALSTWASFSLTDYKKNYE